MPRNRLADETSPYLLQHGDNPVAWYPWGTEALAAAVEADKPILLSIGYAACHWCHVMAHESFEDAEIAALMNELFVNIKVDREERPDLDAIYQAALALLGEHGGWPLTMFLTPAAEPFWGGTYFPPTPRFGRPGFADVLRKIAQVYSGQPDAVRQNTSAILEALKGHSTARAGEAITSELLERISRHLVKEVDPVHGGIGAAPKFPQPAIYELLWRAFQRTGEAAFRDAVILSLDRMCQGGIYDHLGGGFARYAVDQAWLVPHFEKMLYDNAQLIDILCLVWQEVRNPLYAARIGETIEWVMRDMRHPEGGFLGSLDADSEGEEGKFYVWDEAEIDVLLGPRAASFKLAYDVRAGGNWEGHTILNRSRAPALGDDDHEAMLAECRTILWRHREDRIHPGLDDKILADWNGLAIAALANAALAFENRIWLKAATDAFRFVCQRMTADDRLRHAWRAGRLAHPATLDDYANMSRAALALYEATGDEDYLGRAVAWVGVADRHYWDADQGGYFFSADDTDDVITRTKTAADHAVPSGNGTLVQVLARIYYLTGETAYRTRAEATVKALSGELDRNFFPLATLLNAGAFLAGAWQIVIIGDRADDGVAALLRAVHGLSLPDRVVRVIAPGAALPLGHPALGKGQTDGRATAYVCRGPVCSLPLTDADALATALRGT